jgi:hypothetical protein
MTHHHEHDHEHHHDHGDHHHHDVKSELTFKEKMIKLMDHWIKHNLDHGTTYKDWAKKAKANDLPEIGALLEDVHDMTLQINDKFEMAARIIR